MNGPTTLVDTAPACRGAHTAAHRRPRVPEVVVVAGTGGRVPARVPAGRLRLPRQRGDQLVAGVEPFLLVDAVVAVDDGAGLVAGQEHGDALGDAGADQVAGGGGSRRCCMNTLWGWGRASWAGCGPDVRRGGQTLIMGYSADKSPLIGHLGLVRQLLTFVFSEQRDGSCSSSRRESDAARGVPSPAAHR